MMDKGYYPFIQTHGLHSTKTEPLRKLWTLGNNYVSLFVTNIDNGEAIDNRRGYSCGGKGYMENLYTSQFCFKPKVALKNKVFFKKTKEIHKKVF